ncbi:MAG: twin-arginine translocation signal domain-containing protein, partial [Anaerolineaceae bacterium]|nr:twin-arginine translocation signal domain-containing protein [Anaerolineaceae bacterium]
MSASTKGLSRRDFLRSSAAVSAVPVLGQVATTVVHAQEPVTIRLTAWGNPTEYEARLATNALFEESQDAIKVE